MSCESDVKLNVSELSAAECITVTTVCMLGSSEAFYTDRVPFLLLCACQETVFNFPNYLPAYLQYLSPVCCCAKA